MLPETDEFTTEELIECSHIFLDHGGKENAITSGELYGKLKESDRIDLPANSGKTWARGLVRALVERKEYPIAGSTTGYWLIANEEEYENYRENLKQRISGIERRLEAVDAAVESNGFPGEPVAPA